MNALVKGARALARVGGSVRGVARVFRADASERQALEHDAHRAALAQMGAEFAASPRGWFDEAIDGLNRMPRPLLAFGTIGLFVYAMVDPWGFAGRMQGLQYVPEPLWWLLGAIVGFYFGARELHYRRGADPSPRPEARTASWHHSEGGGGPTDGGGDGRDAVASDNPALADWRRAANRNVAPRG